VVDAFMSRTRGRHGPRILSDEQVARIREVFTRVRKSPECHHEIQQLPTPAQLATEFGCSVALVRLISEGYRYVHKRAS
jgi:tripartite-type tricarboxylate transporter receptor subunit TctC